MSLPRDKNTIDTIRELLHEQDVMFTPYVFSQLIRVEPMATQQVNSMKQRIAILEQERNIYRNALQNIKESKELLAQGSKSWVSAHSALTEGDLIRSNY